MNAKYFANRNEGKNETKQKRETKTKLISKKNINKQHTAYLPPVPHLSREGKRIRKEVMATMISNLKRMWWEIH